VQASASALPIKEITIQLEDMNSMPHNALTRMML
jgi:hypothetical protein